MSSEQVRPVSEGALAFRAWLAGPPRRNQAAVAKILGCGQQAVSSWARGTVLPGLLHRVKLKTIAGIAPELWLPLDRRASAALSLDEERSVLAAGNAEAKGAA